ncbi:YfjI family protein [Chromobacterium piscinae]|uniref:YfjI family protein n=1 Tax=Chromobacterium piscinae TaxID=686831 RepID=A0ABV0H0M5_9NEIS
MKTHFEQNRFPIEALPRSMRAAVLEIHQETQISPAMVATFAIAVASEAVHGAAVLRTHNGQLNLLSNWTLVLAESGSGKSPAMQKLRQPILQFEAKKYQQHQEQLKQYHASYEYWKLIKKELAAQVKNNVRDEENPSSSQAKFTAHILNEPTQPRLIKLSYPDTTIQAFFNGLFENWPSAALVSDEASAFFNGAMASNLAQLNQRWELGPLSIDRRSNAKQIYVEDPRVMLNLAIQPDPFEKYLKRTGNEARDLGFLARLLICYADGSEPCYSFNPDHYLPDAVHHFQARVHELLSQMDKQSENKTGAVEIRFSDETDFFSEGKAALIRDGYQLGNELSQVKDYGAKLHRHFIRLAGVLEYFETGKIEVSLNTAESAFKIACWYTWEYMRLFKQPNEMDCITSDTFTISTWLRKQNSRFIRKNDLRKLGPIRDLKRINLALDNILYTAEIEIFTYKKISIIDKQPHLVRNQLQFQNEIFGWGGGKFDMC